MFHVLVIISFPLDETPDVSLLAWTTTPWTLPSNLAVVVHPELIYVKVKGKILKQISLCFHERIEFYTKGS